MHTVLLKETPGYPQFSGCRVFIELSLKTGYTIYIFTSSDILASGCFQKILAIEKNCFSLKNNFGLERYSSGWCYWIISEVIEIYFVTT